MADLIGSPLERGFFQDPSPRDQKAGLHPSVYGGVERAPRGWRLIMECPLH